jgi:hypothetical protein
MRAAVAVSLAGLGQNVSADWQEVTVHGKYTIQALGSLNCVCCLEPPPVIRLWASWNLHNWHMHHLNEVDCTIAAVQKTSNYKRALVLLPRYEVSRKA